MILFTCLIDDFCVIPKRRSPNKTKWRKDGSERKYLENKRALAWEFKKRYTGEMIQEFVLLSCSIHLPHRRITDLGNLVGTIEDALQEAGIVENDYLISDYGRCRRRQKTGGPARVAITLRRPNEDELEELRKKQKEIEVMREHIGVLGDAIDDLTLALSQWIDGYPFDEDHKYKQRKLVDHACALIGKPRTIKE